MNTLFQAGFASVDWTPAPGLPLLGQMHQRLATRARDALLVCAAAFREGKTTSVLAAVDVCILDNAFVADVQNRWQAASGLDGSTLLVHSTHTHVAPATTSILYEPPLLELQETLKLAILQAAHNALKKLEPVAVFAAAGQLEFLGWNRRALFEDGRAEMYGHSEMPGFQKLEGPRDPQLPVLWTKNAAGKITGVLTGFATHPNCMESESFYSADLPGEARKYIKQFLGAETEVVYLTGAAGNTAPSILDPFAPHQPWRGDGGARRSGMYLAGEAAKLISSTFGAMESPVLQHAKTTLQIPLRNWPNLGDKTNPNWPGIEYYKRAAQDWPRRLKNENPFPVNINVLRIGNAVICTNPAELFVEFGLEIKADSPSRVTFISELTDGYCGYVPTMAAFQNGGYETWCAPSSQLEYSGGDQIVQASKALLRDIFQKKNDRGIFAMTPPDAEATGSTTKPLRGYKIPGLLSLNC